MVRDLKILGSNVSASDCTLVRWQWLAALIALVSLVTLVSVLLPSH